MDYTISNSHNGARNILVVDCGAGKTDVALATVEEGILEILSVASDLHLGGQDFDKRVLNLFVNNFRRKYGKDLTTNCRALLRLSIGCEILKCELSSGYNESTSQFVI